MIEQLALSILQRRLVAAHQKESQTEDADRMAQRLIEEEAPAAGAGAAPGGARPGRTL